MAEPKVVIVHLPGFAAMPAEGALQVAAANARIETFTSIEVAKDAVQKLDQIDIFVSNAPDFDLIANTKNIHPKALIILATDVGMPAYSEALRGKDADLLDHVVALRAGSTWSIHQLRITIQKLLRRDFFGLEKYLNQGSKIYDHLVTSSRQRDPLNAEVMRFAESCQLTSLQVRVLRGVSEELLMNALYDAPVAAGRKDLEARPRTDIIELGAKDAAHLRYGCDGDLFVIGCEDPFGRFTHEKFKQYTKKVLLRADSDQLIDTKHGGAGLGLYKILHSCHGLVVNVEAKKRTEVIALLDLNEQVRDFAKMPRSIHYFS